MIVPGQISIDGARYSFDHTDSPISFSFYNNNFGIVVLDSSGGAISFLLPEEPPINSSLFVCVKNPTGTVNNITISTEGSETIDGSASIVLDATNHFAYLFWDGLNWVSISNTILIAKIAGLVGLDYTGLTQTDIDALIGSTTFGQSLWNDANVGASRNTLDIDSGGSRKRAYAVQLVENLPQQLNNISANMQAIGAPTIITSTAFDALTEYENRLYEVIGQGPYWGGRKLTDRDDTYSAASGIHVKTTGNDTIGDGSEGNPYLTIDKAVSVAVDTDTIWVHEGTYVENTSGNGYLIFVNRSYATGITISAVPGHRVIITAASGSYVVRMNGNCDNITFRRLEFQPLAGSTSIFYSSGTSTFDGISFIECSFIDNQVTTICFYGLATGTASNNFRVLRCLFQTDGGLQHNVDNVVGIDYIGNVWLNTSSSGSAIFLRDGLSGTININSNTFVSSASTSAMIISSEAFVGSADVVLNRNCISGTSGGVRFLGGTSGNEMTLNASYNDINVGGDGLVIQQYCDGGTVSYNRIRAGVGNPGANGHWGLGAPEDSGATGPVTGMTIEYNDVESVGGHCFGISTYGDNQTVRYNKFSSAGLGDNACVIKGGASTGHSITHNRMIGGTVTAALFKGGSNTTFEHNHLSMGVASGDAIQFDDDPITSAVPHDNTIRYNLFEVTNGDLILVALSSGDLSTDVLMDFNTYLVSGSGGWGTLFGSSISSLATMQSRWAASGPSGTTANDVNSTDN